MAPSVVEPRTPHKGTRAHIFDWRKPTISAYTLAMAIRVRVLKPEEIPAISALIAASVRGLQAEDYSEEEREAAIATVFTVDTRLVEDGTYFGAFTEDDLLVGCGGWSARKTLFGGYHQLQHTHHDHAETQSDEYLDPATDRAKIRAIFVHPSHARQGIGSLLLSASEDAARAAGFCRFEMASTLTGLSLYRLRGYRDMERIRVPVGRGLSIDVIRMVRRVG